MIYRPKRAKLLKVDQGSKEHLQKAMREINAPLDVIIDDGGHQMMQQQVSFETLFPYVRPGGMYIIEDLHTSYLKPYQNDEVPTTIEYLKKQVDLLQLQETPDISSISFYPKLAVIRKKPLYISE